MKAPPLPGLMICCLSTVQRRPSCSMTCPARIRLACCFMAIACVVRFGDAGLLDPGGGAGKLGPVTRCVLRSRHERRTAKGMTLAEFLDWEERQELRYEFDGFWP